MQTYAEKALRYYGEVCLYKDMVRQAGLGGRAIPAYVSEWIVTRFVQGDTITEATRQQIQTFINNHLPTKDQKERLKNQLMNDEPLMILDEYRVEVDLNKGDRRLQIPLLDEGKASITDKIIDDYPLLLGSGVWGVGKLRYRHAMDREPGRIWMQEFRPMQAASLNFDLFTAQRQHFTLEEWRHLLINSMGYNTDVYDPKAQGHLLTRLLPVVQERVNLIELAPKGTGKSYIYLNLSRYVRLISGGKVTPAVLFYNNATHQPGLLSQFDVVVFDEAQTLTFDNPGEVIGVLKDYLESGQFSRGGKTKLSATAGLVMLANIPLTADMKPRNKNLFSELPAYLSETAFIDRIHGIIPGWELPRITEDAISRSVGFKADFMGEIFHVLRTRPEYEQYVERHTRLTGTKDRRDRTAIVRLATGFLKLLFPDLEVTVSDFHYFCLAPAISLRQRVREQLALLDPEFSAVQIGIAPEASNG